MANPHHTHPHYPIGEKNPGNYAAETHAVVRMGKALLSAGAGSYRVRQSMEQVAAALGIDWLQSHVTIKELTVTVFNEAKFRTQVGQIHSIGVNADKLTRLERLANYVHPGMTAKEVEAELDAIDHRKALYSRWLNGFWGGAATGGFAFLNNAGTAEIIGVTLVAWLGQLLRTSLLRKRFNQYIASALACLSAALAYVFYIHFIHWFGWGQPVSFHQAALFTTVLFVVPGFPLVTSALDLAKSDFVSGTSRFLYEMMILSGGIFALLAVTRIFNIVPNPLPDLAIPTLALWIFRAIASFVGVYGFASMLNTSWKISLAAAVFCTVANLGRFFLLDNLNWPEWISAALATFLIGILAYAVGSRTGVPVITLTVPATLVMVPGGPFYRAVYWFVEFATMGSQPDMTQSHEVNLMFSNLSAGSMRVVGMGVGLVIARLLTDKLWRYEKRHDIADLV